MTRKRGRPAAWYEVSSSPESRKAASRFGSEAPIRSSELLELGRLERRPAFERAQVPVAAHDRRLADLEVEVARAAVDRDLEDSLEVQAANLVHGLTASELDG